MSKDKRMVRADSSMNCVRGRLYYYDFLDEESRGHIPESALRHIVRCPQCQAQINRLRGLLGEKESDAVVSRRRRNTAVASILKLHFGYAGSWVKCSSVRPFLPSLADPALEVRIPTPITAHVDACRACSDDVSRLRDMGLTHKQLCRLGQLFADKKGEDCATGCAEASKVIPDVVEGRFNTATAETLRHLCTCPQCRQSVYQSREKLLDELLVEGAYGQKSGCEGLPAGELFEYCVPYGLDPADDAPGDSALAAEHLSGCPRCLGQIQRLHETLCGIAERPDSKVVTRFTFEDGAGKQASVQAGDPQADWSVNVEVYKSVPAAEPSMDVAALARQATPGAARISLARILRPAALAAVAMLLVSVLFLNTPAAKAVDLSQVYAAIAKVKSVCITSFYAGKTEPYQKEWRSQTMNIRMFKNDEKNEIVLWDIASGLRKARTLSSSTFETTTPSSDVLKRFSDGLANSFGLMPFATPADVPKDAKWTRVDDVNVAAVVPGAEVYDLTWVETDNGVQWPRKKRYWVDPRTGLPRRTDYYRKDASATEGALTMTVEVEYPADSEIQTLIHAWFGAGPLP